MKVAYITNAEGNSGVGHRAVNIAKRLEGGGDVVLDRFDMGKRVEALRKWPGILGTKTVGWLRLGGAVRREIEEGDYDVVHLTNQTLSFLVSDKVPTVVTVHDIIELLDPQTRGACLVNKYLYSGIAKADHVIAVSEYTAQTLRDFYKLPDDRITVIPNGVGDEFYCIDNFSQSIACQALKQELKLGGNVRVVLYVGSDHLRKNVMGAVQAFAKAREKMPELVFIKVGEPGIAVGREMLLKEIDKLRVRDAVRFVGSVSDERLNELYNLAQVLIYPSKFEGFGLPPLQALKSGTLVVCSNATSLPEVVGDAALMHDPEDIEGMAGSIIEILENDELTGGLRVKGFKRAKKFSWGVASDKVKSIYEMISEK